MATTAVVTTSSKMPALLKLLIAICLVRAVWGIAEVVPLMRYLLSGRLSSPWFIYVLLVESLLWFIVGIALWKLKAWARTAAIVLAGIAVLLGGRGLIVMMMNRVSPPSSYALVIAFLLVDFFVIWYLSLPAIKPLFEGHVSAVAQTPTQP